MKTKMLFSLWILAGVVFAGDPVPNFTGKWILDAKRSQVGQATGPGRGGMSAQQLNVVQNQDTLIIERFVSNEFRGDFTIKEKVSLDGKETLNSAQWGDRKFKATWSKDQKSLTIQSEMERSREGQSFRIQSTEVWTLEEGGKVLKLEHTWSGPFGEFHRILYYNKAEK